MKNNLLICVYICVAICAALDETNCKLDEKCINLTQCKTLFDVITTKNITQENVAHLRKSHCGFEGREPKVCCPTKEKIKNQATVKPGVVIPNYDVCGKNFEDRILGGIYAQLGGYPWNVLLNYKKPLGAGFNCGGVLISDRYVLTAAHCVLDIPNNWNLISVRVGEHDISKDLDCEEFLPEVKDCADPVIDVAVETKIVHEKYKIRDPNRYYDIALLRLAQTVKFTEFISPICLPAANIEKSALFDISGWNASRENGGSGVKMRTNVAATTNSKCAEILRNNGSPMKLRDDQVCATQIRPSQRLCSTDSGGALSYIAINAQYANHVAYGVLSFGPRECSSKEPLVYTKVESYLQWIFDHIVP